MMPRMAARRTPASSTSATSSRKAAASARRRVGSGDVVAAAERIDNTQGRPAAGPGVAGGPRAAVERFKLWQNGRTLRVRFLDGVASVQDRCARSPSEWEDVANLTLQFVTSGTAEIRISFAEQGFSWSTVGTDALTVPRAEPTMNYGWLEPDTALTEYQRVVRHEFGHALGMIHEHQNPDALGKIPWDKPKVYEYYARQGGRGRTSMPTCSTSTTRIPRTSPRSTRRRSCSTRSPRS